MEADVSYIRRISLYLNVPLGKLSCEKYQVKHTVAPNTTITGLGTIVMSLAKQAKIPHLGRNAEDESLVRQWFEFISCFGPSFQITPIRLLQELNVCLSRQAYFIGNYQTLADVLMYYVLYNIMSNLSLQEKEKLQHLSRWFANIQLDPDVRQSNKLLCFSRTPLYT